MKKLTSGICGAVVAVFAAIIVAFGGINGYSAKAEGSAKNQKFALDTGDYTLKMDDSVTMDVSYAHGATYLYNKRDTKGNIRLKFKTNSVSSTLANNIMYGLVRGKSEDLAYAYGDTANTYWYIFGNHISGSSGKTIYKADAYTDILYNVTTHAFGVSIDGSDVTGEMSKFTSSANADVVDSKGATKICWDSVNIDSNDPADTIAVSLTDFALTDAEGYDLGVAMGRMTYGKGEYSYNENVYGYAGKTVTVKYIGDGDGGLPLVYGSDGARLSVPVDSLGNGEYSFVMPSDNVRLVMKRWIENSEIYGTYLSATSGNYFVFGEQSYQSINGVKTDIDIVAYTGGMVDVIEGENTAEGLYAIGKLVLGDTVYKKLLNYSVSFVVDGQTVKSETLSSGDYFATAPEDPKKDGYVFAGWRTSGGEAFEADKTITGSTTFYAVFNEEGGHVDPKEESKGGCGGHIAYAGFAIIPFAAVFFCLKIKREGGR